MFLLQLLSFVNSDSCYRTTFNGNDFMPPTICMTTRTANSTYEEETSLMFTCDGNVKNYAQADCDGSPVESALQGLVTDCSEGSYECPYILYREYENDACAVNPEDDYVESSFLINSCINVPNNGAFSAGNNFIITCDNGAASSYVKVYADNGIVSYNIH